MKAMARKVGHLLKSGNNRGLVVYLTSWKHTLCASPGRLLQLSIAGDIPSLLGLQAWGGFHASYGKLSRLGIWGPFFRMVKFLEPGIGGTATPKWYISLGHDHDDSPITGYIDHE